ncbi:hypothetical protein L7F22_028060 [Adiantum nelumboides]|nr:hypothetical protein [Adiantum nelumboides]
MSSTHSCAHTVSEIDVASLEYNAIPNLQEPNGKSESETRLSFPELRSRRDTCRVWSSEDLKLYKRRNHVRPSFPYLNSSWVQRLAPRSRLKARSSLNCGHLDVQLEVRVSNQSKDLPAHENSRSGVQGLELQPCAAIVAKQNSEVLNAVPSRNKSHAEGVSQFMQPEVCLAPRLLPMVAAVLPSYSKNVDHLAENRRLHEASQCAGVCREEKHLFSGNRLKVSHSIIVGLESASTRGRTKPAEQTLEHLPQGSGGWIKWKGNSANSRTDYLVGRCKDWQRRWSTAQKKVTLQFGHLFPEKTVDDIIPLHHGHAGGHLPSSVGRSVDVQHIAWHKVERRAPESIQYETCMERPTFRPPYQTSCNGYGEVVNTDTALCGSRQELNSLLRGMETSGKREVHYGENHPKTKGSRHLYSSGVNLADYTLHARYCTNELDEGCDSSSDSNGDIKDYTLPGWNEKSMHYSHRGHRKRCRDQYSPSLNVFREEGSSSVPQMWLQRWSSQSETLRVLSSAQKESRDCPVCCDKCAQRPSKRTRHENGDDRLKNGQSGFHCTLKIILKEKLDPLVE